MKVVIGERIAGHFGVRIVERSCRHRTRDQRKQNAHWACSFLMFQLSTAARCHLARGSPFLVGLREDRDPRGRLLERVPALAQLLFTLLK